MKKYIYVSPRVEVIEMENEGVIATSGNPPSYGDDGSAFSRSNSLRKSASSNDLESLIEDILTVEN